MQEVDHLSVNKEELLAASRVVWHYNVDFSSSSTSLSSMRLNNGNGGTVNCKALFNSQLQKKKVSN